MTREGNIFSSCSGVCHECTAPKEFRQEFPIVAQETIAKWQCLVNTLARVARVPAALVMRIDEDDIEVFVSSESDGNPWVVGERATWKDSGLYCEHVVKTRAKLLVPDARSDARWSSNPDIELDMVSYLGFPITTPHGQVFGTICVLDTKANAYSEIIEELMVEFKELLEAHLKLVCQGDVLRHINDELQQRLSEVKTLRGFISICSSCKRVRTDVNSWEEIEDYVRSHSAAEFTHSICADCARKLYPDLEK